MRHRYRMEADLGTLPIEKIPIPMKSRDELPPVLRALQYIYCSPELKEQIFAVLEKKIVLRKMGTPGMSLWEILVMGVIRLTLQADYDRLEHIVNYDELVRAMLGIQKFGAERKEYSVQTLRDNMYLLDEPMLEEINALVVSSGHALKKKDEEAATDKKGLSVKVDSFVVECNVHFPTDYNLLWDSLRKSLCLTDRLLEVRSDIYGWRKIDYWIKECKREYQSVRRSSQRGGKNREKNLKTSVRQYLRTAKKISEKMRELKEIPAKDEREALLRLQIEYYADMVDKHIDLLERRILKNEKIPHDEKLFSIFEPYTEWISKGKANRAVELGIKVCIATDQHGFILKHVVMQKQEDVDVITPLSEELLKSFEINSLSIDKGFWSKENFNTLEGKVKVLVMPKKGKRTQKEYDREHGEEFIRLRKRHSAVESNINALEHHGAGRCLDRGIKGFRRCVALSVLAYNLHRLGNCLLEQDRLAPQKKAV